ncbi:MAG: S9 family peptidase [Oceanicaulis sp.]|uniref:S9 family peptidase n=2 Tax=Oceanicaulis TaxID=153232 RepID=UPI000C6881A6|nr:S9 family peptidase [Oceanicaulis sp.]MBG36034.1 S9 family peptidase [Oceanicaulis sp.]HBU61848.1 S9 family peptidase [Oceanicaulis sp.]HCR95097.1 S9 family peptidase [Oceanicaulis sp.]
MRHALSTCVCLLALIACAPSTDIQASEPADPAALSIDDVFGSANLAGATPRGLRFSPDGERVTFLRPKDDDRTVTDLWAMDLSDGRTYMLVDSAVLAPDERELSEAEIQYRERARISTSGVVSYDWDETGEAILVPLDGDVFYVDVNTGEAERLMQTEAFETDARVSPDGSYVSFIRDQNLWVHDLETGEERALTTEGGDAISWGVAEFVAQEEMSRYTGYWWSPDGRYIAAARIDETPVEIVPRFGINAEGVTITDQRYPRAGTPNVLIELHVIDVATGERTQVDLGEETDIYLARVNWSQDSGTLYAQRQNRAQTVLDILAASPETGATETVLTEQNDAWINLTNDFRALEDGGFLWTSERTGFRHIYHVSADGAVRPLTSGEWVVDDIAGLSEDGATVYFEGWVTSPLERHLYAVPFEGGEPVQITEGEGRWSVSLGQGGTGFIGSYSDPDTPPQTALYDISGERVAWIEENTIDEDHPYAPFLASHLVPEFGTVLADDGATELYWSMLKPDHCSAANPCPAIVQVYGGPHVQTVSKGWVGARDQLFADEGYILFKLDNRGSWNRGLAFEAELHDRMGTVEVRDQLTGLDYLESLDFVDNDRIGLWGWSYGGYMTLMTTLQAPGRFDAAVSGAPVTDWSLYDTHYTERYMDTPQNNESGYYEGSAFAHLDGYETPTLLIHGMADDNVTFDHATRLYAELQERGELFEMMTYPGQRHGVRPPALQQHLWTTIYDFFGRELAEEDEE